MSRRSATPSRNPLSVGHLVAGLVFLGLAAIWALHAGGVVTGDDTWLLPAILVLAGAAGLAASVASGLRRRTTNDTGVTEADDHHR